MQAALLHPDHPGRRRKGRRATERVLLVPTAHSRPQRGVRATGRGAQGLAGPEGTPLRVKLV